MPTKWILLYGNAHPVFGACNHTSFHLHPSPSPSIAPSSLTRNSKRHCLPQEQRPTTPTSTCPLLSTSSIFQVLRSELWEHIDTHNIFLPSNPSQGSEQELYPSSPVPSTQHYHHCVAFTLTLLPRHVVAKRRSHSVPLQMSFFITIMDVGLLSRGRC